MIWFLNIWILCNMNWNQEHHWFQQRVLTDCFRLEENQQGFQLQKITKHIEKKHLITFQVLPLYQ